MDITFPQNDLWHTLLADKRPKLIYGMGDGADKLIARLEEQGIDYADVFASDDFVRGQFFHGKRVITLKEAEERYADFVVLVSFATRLPEVITHIESIAKQYTLYVPDMPAFGESYFDLSLCKAHQTELSAVADMWADSRSKEVYALSVNAKLTGSLTSLLSSCDAPLAGLSLLSPNSFTVAVDAGAYTGDTARELLQQSKNLQRIYAIEPDPHTFKKLALYAEEETRAEILPIEGAAWCREAELSFFGKGNRGSHAKGKGKQVNVKGVTVDRICRGVTVDYLKFDVEGAEKEALIGAEQTIRNSRPAILLSLYHRAEDLFLLPLQLKALCPNYDFWLRREKCLPLWELNLLALPREKQYLTVDF